MITGVWGRCAAELESEPQIEVDAATAAEMATELALEWQRTQRQQAAFSKKLRKFDLAHAAPALGALTTAAFLRSQLHMSVNQATQQVMVARQLDDLPETAQAL